MPGRLHAGGVDAQVFVRNATAYCEGYKVGRDGGMESDNPHDQNVDPTAYIDWARGFNHGDNNIDRGCCSE